MSRLSLIILALLSLLLPACARLDVRHADGSVASLRPLARVAAGSPLAWRPDGGSLAAVRDGLVVIDVATGKVVRLDDEKPVALAWGGRGLAAAYMTERGSRLRLYDDAGDVVGSFETDGLAGNLAWHPDGTLLVTLSRLTHYRFGSNLKTTLLRWRPDGAGEETELGETTLKPGTAQGLGERVPGYARIALSPLGDEFLFTVLLDPPAFAPYLRIALRRFDCDAERLVGKGALASAGGLLLADGETLVFTDGEREVRVAATWEEGSRVLYPQPGRTLAAAGDDLFADGVLVRRGEPVLRVPLQARPFFAPDGAQLALLIGGEVYLVPLEPSPLSPVPPSPRLLQLRRLRAQGLITLQEYRTYVEKESADDRP